MIAKGTVTADLDVFDAIEEQQRRWPVLVAGELRRRQRSLRRRLKASLLVTPPQPDLPFIWSRDPVKQAKARGWYFANKVPRGSRGGRHQRTGQLQEAWELDTVRAGNGGLIEYRNEAPGAPYVYGPRQVPSHTASGWPDVDKIDITYNEIATNELIDVWFTLTDEFAGVRSV